MTSLNSAGIHVSLLKLTESHRDIFLKCLDDETMAPCWPGSHYSIPSSVTHRDNQDDDNKKEKVKKMGILLNVQERHMMKQCLKNACTAIIEKEGYLNELDRGCGDGDCGLTLKRLADGTQYYVSSINIIFFYYDYFLYFKLFSIFVNLIDIKLDMYFVGILNDLDNLSLSHPVALLSEIGSIAEEHMGGTSGALYCLFFTTAAKELALFGQKENFRYVWYCVFLSGLNCLEKYGKAKVGDRTMVCTCFLVKWIMF